MRKYHGLTKHPLYRTWCNMKARCNNPKNDRFADWGGRGIKVCAEWEQDAEAFICWALANGYAQGLTLDRIDNERNYSPENCRFVNQYVQQRNTRPRRRLKNSNLPAGVSIWGKRFRAQILSNGKRVHLGLFLTPEEAHAAYNMARSLQTS